MTGWEGSQEYFRFVEAEEIRPSLVMDVLRGRQLGVVFRDVVSADTREALITNFLTSLGRRTRGADAPGEYLGAYHYNKTIDEYFDQTDAVRADLDAALDVPSEPLGALYRQLGEALAPSGIEFRPARHQGREACAGIFRSWLGQRDFALDPHEDRGQCEDPKQVGFEIQQVTRHHIVGLNICLDNGSDGGLTVWNLRPDEATRARLGVRYTGSPYAIDWLTGIDRLLLDVRPGDIYLLNAGHVHAVEPVRDPDARRVTLSGILGFTDDTTVIAWT
ncbi:hypothetical protein QTQ03_09055 [Micromonospora sp. WMMA1363]|uniref:hypothetical protein n=1 Tax=Micromonospora sp. WMMA1363 TaxID=3053985 RepID=UPI00259CB4AD|nr:hypothetical protein [Micromonospora sp. WMMA1363]MDM4719717.1 hypothetical protein [Micromonospora sp. WMMA1363]